MYSELTSIQSNGNFQPFIWCSRYLDLVDKIQVCSLGVFLQSGKLFPCLFKQQIKFEYNSYYSKKFIFEFLSIIILCKCVCINMCCDLLLKLLCMVSEDFSKAQYLISSWSLQEPIINFALNFLYEEMIPLTFPSTKFLILFVGIQNECSYSMFLGRCE